MAAGLTPDFEAGGQGGDDVHPMAPDDRWRIGAFLHRKFLTQDGGPGIVAEKEKLVLGKVPGNGQGPDRVAVSDAVDPIENFGHSLRTWLSRGEPGVNRGKGFLRFLQSQIHYEFRLASGVRIICRTLPPQVTR